jgi:hypothetical protein
VNELLCWTAPEVPVTVTATVVAGFTDDVDDELEFIPLPPQATMATISRTSASNSRRVRRLVPANVSPSGPSMIASQASENGREERARPVAFTLICASAPFVPGTTLEGAEHVTPATLVEHARVTAALNAPNFVPTCTV